MSMKECLSKDEKTIIVALLRGNKDNDRHIELLDEMFVLHLNDGGMGSLQLTPRTHPSTSRSFGKQIALGEFLDADGVPVSISLNIDTQGQLFELDVWKVDFSPLISWPSPGSIKIIE